MSKEFIRHCRQTYVGVQSWGQSAMDEDGGGDEESETAGARKSELAVPYAAAAYNLWRIPRLSVSSG